MNVMPEALMQVADEFRMLACKFHVQVENAHKVRLLLDSICNILKGGAVVSNEDLQSLKNHIEINEHQISAALRGKDMARAISLYYDMEAKQHG